MRTLLLCVALLQASLYQQARSNAIGAPPGACDTLAPDPAGHLNAQPQTSAVPYSIDLDQFCVNGNYSYTPGATYTGLSLHAENDMPQFRGVLIQARMLADDTTRLGTFAVSPDSNTTTRLSRCPTDTDGITHSNGNDKGSVYFDWTAPDAGSGALRFGFAVVQVRTTYWADQRTGVIGEAGVGGDACTITTESPTEPESQTDGSTQLTSVGFSTLLMVALAVVIKIAL